MNTREKDFLRLIECFSKNELRGERKKDDKQFESVISKLDQILGNKEEDYKLVAENTCPIVFAGEKIKYVFLGLNPHKDECDFDHLDTWEKFAHYHTVSGLEEDNSFKRVTNKVGPYYRNVAKMCASLEEKKFISWKEYRGKCNTEELQVKYLKLIDELKLGVAELIPFASRKTVTISKTKLEEIIGNVEEMKNYLITLMDVLKNRVEEDGVIICNGKGICEAFETICDEFKEQMECREVLDRREDGYSVSYVNGIKVIKLYHFLGAFNGKLSSDDHIAAMIKSVCEV